MPRIAIIAGAGPAGLTAAYELLKRADITPLVFESTEAIGGISQTYQYKGNRIDLGGHRFFSKNERVMRWWFNILPPQGAPAVDAGDEEDNREYPREVVQDYLCPHCVPPDPKAMARGLRVVRPAPDPQREDAVMLRRPRSSRIYYNRSFFPYPLTVNFSVASRLGLMNTLLMGLSYAKAQIFPVKDETYLDAFFTNRFGRRLYETFFRDYTQKVWGIPCSQIRADWGAQRIKGLSLRRVVSQAIRDLAGRASGKTQARRETTLITEFFYPKFGPGQMWETVATQVAKCGGEVVRRRRVSGVTVRNGRIVSASIENLETGSVESVACDYFFSSMPIKHLIGMMEPSPDETVRQVADGLKYRDFLTVGLLLKNLHVRERGQPSADRIPDNWVYIQDAAVRVGRIQIFNNWSPYMACNHRETVWIGLEYFVNEGDDTWSQSDRSLIDLGLAEIEKIGFARREDFLDGCVQRMQKAYPAYHGSYDRLALVRKYTDNIPNLFLVGRNGMHRYNNQDHSMLTSMTAVDNIVNGRSEKDNIWDVNTEQNYHEEADAPEEG